MKLGIVGGGTVGRATARCYIEHAEVRVFDILPERATHSLAEVMACDIVFVCLPTPQIEGSLMCDLVPIVKFFEQIDRSRANLVLRSTVPIGATRRLRAMYDLPNLVHSPEFLTARCAVTDAQLPARNIIGYPRADTLQYGGLEDLYRHRFSGVPVHLMTSDESEFVKLAQNGFFATKIAYWNECRTLADNLDLDWDRVLSAVLADGRISHSHTRVPGPDGKYGFGGACLEKDLASLVSCIEQAGLSAAVTRAAYERNLEDRDR